MGKHLVLDVMFDNGVEKQYTMVPIEEMTDEEMEAERQKTADMIYDFMKTDIHSSMQFRQIDDSIVNFPIHKVTSAVVSISK